MTQLSEVFLAGGTVEKEDNILWKTCLVPGRIELTPGPGGRKLDKPLIFVEGNATNDEEIGLQDIYDAFEESAIQNVTVPLSHSNKILENTGFARKMRWAEEDGKRVLQAGFEIIDPDVAERVEDGRIADVSCGILKNYRKQRTGKTYKSACDHIALTNYPWVEGMSGFTKLSEDMETEGYFFSEQEENIDFAEVTPVPEPDPPVAPLDPLKSASQKRLQKGSVRRETVKLSESNPVKLASAKRQGLNLAINHETDSGNMFDYTAKGVEDITNIGRIVHWDDKNSLVLRQHLVEDALDTEFPDCLLVDFTVGKALLQDENGQHWVAGYSINEDGDVEIHPREEWTSFDPEDNN